MSHITSTSSDHQERQANIFPDCIPIVHHRAILCGTQAVFTGSHMAMLYKKDIYKRAITNIYPDIFKAIRKTE